MRYLPLLLVAFLLSSASGQPSPRRNFVEVTVAEVIQSLAREMGHTFTPPSLVDLEQKVTVDLEESSPEEALRAFLYERDLRFRVDDQGRVQLRKVPPLPDDVRSALMESRAGVLSTIPTEVDARPSQPSGSVAGRESAGEVRLSPREARRAGTALLQSYADGFDKARCFIPRHFLRLDHDGISYGFVICFQCGLMDLYRDDRPLGLRVIIGPDRGLNDILQEHNISVPDSY